MSAPITDGWVLVFVVEPFRLFVHKSATQLMPPRTPAPSLPPELWIYIHRLATGDILPSPSDGDDDSAIPDERDTQRLLQAARSLGRVCKLWNALAQEILYEHVWVNKRFASLSAALERPATARLVRSVRLSTTRFDHNAAVLRQCPHVEVLVQPEFPRAERLYAARDTPLPPLPALRRLYWIESWWSSGLLQRVLDAAPHLAHIALSSSSTIGSDPAAPLAVPALPHLTALALARLAAPCVHAFLRTPDLRQLTRLTIAPAHLASKDCPALPALRTLALTAHPTPTRLPFPAICARCPALRELRYDARSRVEAPEDGEGAPALARLVCVRLRLPVAPHPTVAEAHFRLFCGPAFGALERVVLEGRQWVIVLRRIEGFRGMRDQLSARGCRVEYPEGLIR
ncbi:hypothetical protein B0H11DRAFT_2182682 [Mycena galericulata]|nr:hypothetical protein B0H11DRAFT_2182682 [Mycena galericulata]